MFTILQPAVSTSHLTPFMIWLELPPLFLRTRAWYSFASYAAPNTPTVLCAPTTVPATCVPCVSSPAPLSRTSGLLSPLIVSVPEA